MPWSLPVLNLAEATFECTYGRGCDGLCCREGRPLLYPEEIEHLDGITHKYLPLLRPEARVLIEKAGYLTPRQRKFGERVARSVGGWCIFFNQGCVLHRLGEQEGDKFKYKPVVCSLYPLQKDDHDNWYVRQKGYKRERWDLFCLDPQATETPAAKSLREELALATRLTSNEPEAPAPDSTSRNR